ncbi:MAG: Rnase Y domain-containing protein [Rickettsiaceae bacterium]|nr:Rnase Y domain-containing protein [Rickettsiaceae bacterium]
MKASLFSPILILLILTLFAKASMLFGRIQEQTTYAMDTNTSSILVNSAYAQTTNTEKAANLQAKEQTATQIKSIEAEQKGGLINNLTRSEMELLKELSKRRETLDKEKADLNVREQVLKATENKIDKKVSELKTLQTQLEELMKQYEQKENSKILSLVKIYEAMKPKDAAKIFNELEMPVLLKVVSNMKEIKVAPVIASMDPVKARELSIELSKQKPIG